MAAATPVARVRSRSTRRRSSNRSWTRSSPSAPRIFWLQRASFVVLRFFCSVSPRFLKKKSFNSPEGTAWAGFVIQFFFFGLRTAWQFTSRRCPALDRDTPATPRSQEVPARLSCGISWCRAGRVLLAPSGGVGRAIQSTITIIIGTRHGQSDHPGRTFRQK